MKRCVQTAFLLLVTLCVLLTALPASAELYNWKDGSIPATWNRIQSEAEIDATDLLTPVNPNASREAKNLLAYLSILSDSGQIVSGQFDITNTEKAYNSLKEEFGVEPGLYSARYIVDEGWSLLGKPALAPSQWEDSALAFENRESTNDLLQKHYEMGNILLVHADGVVRTICAELAMQNKPAEYPDPTNAIIELDVTNPDRDLQTYAAWMRFQGNVIASLQDLEARGVKAYMYRPWVEFNNYPFNGKNSVGYDAFVRVYQQTVQMLIDAGLTGFLIAYSPSCGSDTIQRYPGNAYVDTNAVTKYSDSEDLGSLDAKAFEAYDWYVRSGKPLGFSEWSCRTGEWEAMESQPRASVFSLLQSTLTYWPKICWVNFWGDGAYSPTDADGGGLGNDDGTLYMNSPYVLTLDELTDYRTGEITPPGVVQLFTETDGAGDYVGLEERDYSAADLKALGIDLTRVRSLRTNTGYSITFYTGNDCTGKRYGYGFAETAITAAVAKNFKSCSVTGRNNVALGQSEIYAGVNDDNAWKANDGAFSVWSGDVTDKDTAWMRIDLGAVYQIGRYVIKTAGYADYADAYNLAGFDLEYSTDGETWTRIDRVEENTLPQIDRHVEPVMAQYFRLVFTDPNNVVGGSDTGVVTISEWELYGVDPGELTPAPVTDTTPSEPQEEPSSTPEEEEDASQPEEPVPEDIPGVSDEDTEVSEDDESSDTESELPPVTEDESVPEDFSAEEEPEDTDSQPEEDTPDTDDTDRKKPVKIVTTETYFPWWGFLLIGAGVLVAAGLVVFLIIRKKKATKEESV